MTEKNAEIYDAIARGLQEEGHTGVDRDFVREIHARITMGGGYKSASEKEAHALLKLYSEELDTVFESSTSPTLPANTSDGKFLAPPANLLRLLQLGMEARNKLVHIGRLPTDKDWAKQRAILEDVETRRSFFISIQDILWILYYNQGFDWALNHLSLDTQKAIGQIRTVMLGQ